MKATLAVRAVHIAFFVLAALPHAQAEDPSLSETLEWMDSTYNPHTNSGGAWGHGKEEMYSTGKIFKRRTSRFSYDGCQINLAYTR